jgi:hypothetical protein
MERSRGRAHPRSSANYCVVAGTMVARFESRTESLSSFVFQSDACAVTSTSEHNAFLAYFGPGRHSGGCRYRDGSLFASGRFPQGERPAVLFRYAEGRPSQARTSLTDARANGLTSRGYTKLPPASPQPKRGATSSTAIICYTDHAGRACRLVRRAAGFHAVVGERKAGARIIKSVPTTRVDSMAFFQSELSPAPATWQRRSF